MQMMSRPKILPELSLERKQYIELSPGDPLVINSRIDGKLSKTQSLVVSKNDGILEVLIYGKLIKFRVNFT